jgi:hypothetical protein
MRMDGSRGAATRSPGLGANGMMQSQPMCRSDIERHYASSELLKNEQPTRGESRLHGVMRRVLVIPRWALVELIGFEPTTPCLQSRCSPS